MKGEEEVRRRRGEGEEKEEKERRRRGKGEKTERKSRENAVKTRENRSRRGGFPELSGRNNGNNNNKQ